jgi:hypothetical protein
MILGMFVQTFTALHVVISLIGIAAGLVVLFAMLAGKRNGGWTTLFLAATVATSVTGFFFQSKAIGPPHIVGVISLIILAVALFALYVRRMAGAWRRAYVISAVAALYLNCFVAVVQAFQKLSFLKPLAPTGTEPPFAAAQGVVLLLFIGLGFLAVKRFHPVGGGGH